MLRALHHRPIRASRLAVYNVCDDVVIDAMDAMERMLLREAQGPVSRAPGAKPCVIDSARVAEINEVRFMRYDDGVLRFALRRVVS